MCVCIFHLLYLGHIYFSAIQVEVYFLEDDDFGPFSPRNELESLNSILLAIKSLISSAKLDELEVLHVLENATVAMINSFGDLASDCMIAKNFDTNARELLKWGKNHGVRTKLNIACKSSDGFFTLRYVSFVRFSFYKLFFFP